MYYKLGIDVGGTNTDAVILNELHAVIAKCKKATTNDVSSGIKQAVAQVLVDSGIDPTHIKHAMLGTTQSTNAIIERKGLLKVGVIRLSGPSGQQITGLRNHVHPTSTYFSIFLINFSAFGCSNTKRRGTISNFGSA